MNDKLTVTIDCILSEESEKQIKEQIRKIVKDVLSEEFERTYKYVPSFPISPVTITKPIIYEPLSVGDNPAHDPKITCDCNVIEFTDAEKLSEAINIRLKKEGIQNA